MFLDSRENKMTDKEIYKLNAKDFIPLYGAIKYAYRNGSSGKSKVKDGFNFAIRGTALILYNGALTATIYTGLEQLVK